VSIRRAVGSPRTLLFIAFAFAAPAAAQSLELREAEYRAALLDYEAAAAARDIIATGFTATLDSLTVARSIDDRQEIDRLEGQVRARSLQLQSREVRLVELEERVDEARASLLEALDQRLDSLQMVFDLSGSQIQRTEVATLIRDLRNQFSSVSAEDLEERLATEFVSIPAINYDPRDTPQTLQAKAQLADRYAQDFQREIDGVDEDIERFRRDLQLQRISGDARAGVDRFGDAQVPVRGRTVGERTEQGLAADTVGVDLEALPPGEAIERLEILREQLVSARDQMVARARLFRGGGGARGELGRPEVVR
jgi:hypothetical protein